MRFLNVKNILWDFDGVIMDSMKVRDNGFSLVLKEYPEREVDELMRFHQKNGGLSRYVKFRYFFENIRNQEVSDEEINIWAGKFSDIMREHLIDENLIINDSFNFIKQNYEEFRMHIVSGSDQEELRYLCEENNLSSFFISIHGSPTPKKELVRNVMQAYNYNKADTILIGDSINDFEAAEINGINFFGYNNPKLKKLDAGYINNFSCE